MHSPFLKLPVEIRVQIIQILLPREDPVTYRCSLPRSVHFHTAPHNPRTCNHHARRSEPKHEPLSILLVCRSLTGEACDVLYNRTFVMDLEEGSIYFLNLGVFDAKRLAAFPFSRMRCIQLRFPNSDSIRPPMHSNVALRNVLSCIARIMSSADRIQHLSIQITSTMCSKWVWEARLESILSGLKALSRLQNVQTWSLVSDSRKLLERALHDLQLAEAHPYLIA